ncbi:MAG: RidA family protein [Pseudomonadota bacterium]
MDDQHNIAARLEGLGISLPEPAAALANYVPAVQADGTLLFISGQLPLVDGAPSVTGHLGGGVAIDDGYVAARQCAINILAQVKTALDGDLERIERCVKLTGFVAGTPDFTDHPKVVNGASDLMVEALGDRGRHTRAAVGVSALPLGAAVEVEAIFEVRTAG